MEAGAKGHGGLLHMVFQSALLYTGHRTTCSEMALSKMGMAIPHQTLIKKMPLQTCLHANLMKALSQFWLYLHR